MSEEITWPQEHNVKHETQALWLPSHDILGFPLHLLVYIVLAEITVMCQQLNNALFPAKNMSSEQNNISSYDHRGSVIQIQSHN